MSFQIYSDLHMEFRNSFPKIEPIVENLILAGDIGKISNKHYLDFIDYVSKFWKKVFIVLGNHEFYIKSHYHKTINKYRELFNKYKNIFFLNDSEHEFDKDTLIIGGIFWTRASNKLKGEINDYNYIKYFDISAKRQYEITPEFINVEHLKSKMFLIKSLNKKYKNVIIISHFPLTQKNTSEEKYQDQPLYLKNYFANDFDDILNDSKISNIINIAGHTHFSYDFKINNVRYISNQLGYPDDDFKTFNPSKIFTIQ